MIARQLPRDRQTQAGADGADRAFGGAKQFLARPRGQAGADVPNCDFDHIALGFRGDADVIRTRFSRVAGQIGQDSEQLIPVSAPPLPATPSAKSTTNGARATLSRRNVISSCRT